MKNIIFYNYWYVIDYNGRTWKIYTDKEFKGMFEIVEGSDLHRN